MNAWQEHAGDLANVVFAHMVNRTDCYGIYHNGRASTAKRKLTHDTIGKHFQSETCIGLHALSVDNTCRWLAFDIDCHGDDANPAETERYAISLHGSLADLDLEPYLFSSDGKGSHHVFVFFGRPIPGDDCVAFGAWVLSQCPGVPVEVFPKQATAEYGSWLRLPGRHPRHRDCWHQLWSDGWLDDKATVIALLAIKPVDPAPVLDKTHELGQSTRAAVPSDRGLRSLPSETTQRVIEGGAEVGERNGKLFASACDMHGRNYTAEQIYTELAPPLLKSGLKDREIRRTIESAVSRQREPAGEAGERPKFVIRPITALSEGGSVTWLWTGYLAARHISLLIGLWKCGKTTLVGHLLKYFATGGFLAGSVAKAKVLVVSEESVTLWQGRRDELGLGADVHVLLQPFLNSPSATEWTDLLAFLCRAIDKNGYDIVILDPLTTLWGVRDENDAAKVTAALLPLRALCQLNVGVLMLHHPSKTGGTEGRASRGSGALTGFVDSIIELRRYRPVDPEDCRRTLRCYSRFAEAPPEQVIELNNGQYRSIGIKAETGQRDREEVLNGLLPNEPPGLRVEEVVDNWPDDGRVKPVRRVIARDLKRSAEAGLIRTAGKGTRGNPLRFFRPTK